jgi:hypothetical protein
MKRVSTGELRKRLRNCVTGQLTENPESTALGVLSFPACCGKGLWAVAADRERQRAQVLRSNFARRRAQGRQWARPSQYLSGRSLTS